MRLLLAIPYFAPAYAFGGSVTVAQTGVADAPPAGPHGTVPTTDAEREDFLDVGADPARLVRLPLPLELPQLAGVPVAPDPTVAYVGRLHEIKGIDRLIRAVALVRERIPRVRLVVVGPGERYQRRLEALAAELGVADAVEFRGFVSAEE